MSIVLEKDASMHKNQLGDWRSTSGPGRSFGSFGLFNVHVFLACFQTLKLIYPQLLKEAFIGKLQEQLFQAQLLSAFC